VPWLLYRIFKSPRASAHDGPRGRARVRVLPVGGSLGLDSAQHYSFFFFFFFLSDLEIYRKF
jgi:hypothetical protein